MKLFGQFKWNIKPKEKPVGRGLLIFQNTSEVIQTEDILKNEGYTDIKVVSPPPQFRTGCDLTIEFPLVEQLGIIRILEDKNLIPLEVVPLSSERLEPLKLCRIVDYGQYIMVKAANMKITVDKKNYMIVNISGGGCPDVPYLATELIGKNLYSAPNPRNLGESLCAYSLYIAFEEMKKQMEVKQC
ncbi:MAG: DUF3343 domain-containing protein [bacterium]